MTSSSPSPPSFTSSDQPPITPPATLTSFLSFSPSPPVPSCIQTLAPPIDLPSPISAQSTTSFDLDQELDLSPNYSTTNFASNNPFLAILIAQRAQLSSPSPSSSSSLLQSQSILSPSASSASSTISDSERSEREKREERVIYDGSSLHLGRLSSMLDDMMSEETREWEEDTESAWEEELYSSLEEASLEEATSPPVTPILAFTPSSPPFPYIDSTPRARRVQPKLHHSPSPRRKSIIVIASSPLSRSKHSSPRILQSPTSSVAPSCRGSLLPIDGFAHFPTSPINLSTTSPRRSRLRHTFVASTSHLSPQKAKPKSRSKKSPRSPPPLRPIRKTAEGFDADALDQLFGVPRERRANNRLTMEGEEEEWRKVEEFRGLLEEGNQFETETESEEEEVLHVRAPPIRTRAAKKKEKNRPPPLNLGIHSNSFAPQLPPSSFSPDTANLDAPITFSPSSTLVNPIPKESEKRRNVAKEGKRILRGKKSVGERLRGICGIAV
ncbi:hypothetical protein JCM5353_005544 [Sporobolomyces roseus]